MTVGILNKAGKSRLFFRVIFIEEKKYQIEIKKKLRLLSIVIVISIITNVILISVIISIFSGDNMGLW